MVPLTPINPLWILFGHAHALRHPFVRTRLTFLPSPFAYPITAFNVVLTIREYKKQKWSTSDVRDYGYQSKMFYLCIPFVFECAYRSVLPRIDIPRMCFFDVWPSMVLFGRLSAFVGEWCWMLQISLALQKILGELDIVTEKKVRNS